MTRSRADRRVDEYRAALPGSRKLALLSAMKSLQVNGVSSPEMDDILDKVERNADAARLRAASLIFDGEEVTNGNSIDGW